jgi:Dictyostelium (slime mold) repeat
MNAALPRIEHETYPIDGLFQERSMNTIQHGARCIGLTILLLGLLLVSGCETDEGGGAPGSDTDSFDSGEVQMDVTDTDVGSDMTPGETEQDVADGTDGSDIKVDDDGGETSPPECQTDDDCTATMGAPAPWACTSIFCDLETGSCYDGPLPDGTSCQPQDVCKANGACAAGVCTGSERSCDDDDPCTEDSCYPDTGCTHTNVPPDCEGLECGNNACGFFCGTCPEKSTCGEDGVCVPTDPCADFEAQGCVETGCDEGFMCDTSVGCVPSVCACDPETGDVECTADCGGGTCVPVPDAKSTALTGGGSSFGMCGGPCKTDLTLDDATTRLVISGWDDTLFADNQGTLSAAALAKATSLAAALLSTDLDAVYGCPDCADGGAMYVDLIRDSVTSHHAYEYGNPPTALVDADLFVSNLIEALRNCTSTEWITPDASCAPQ